MIDLHTHVLPGIDDGVGTIDDALALARAAAADGVRVLAATPHVRDDYPTAVETMELLVEELVSELSANGVEIDLRPGGEIALDRLGSLSDTELRRFGLGGNPGYLLLEFPYSGWPLALEQAVFELKLRGITAVLAHPERNPDVQERPERLRAIVEGGALVQLTAASVDGRLGRRPRDTSMELLRLDLAHLLASDAHAPSIREVGLAAAAMRIGEPLAGWLTEGVPGAIVREEELPERPQVEGRRRRFGFKRSLF